MRGPVLPALCLAALLCLTACGAGEEASSPTPTPVQTSPPPMATVTPTPTPYNGPVNPLSGMPTDAETSARRPVAVMLNNLKQALPQLGQSQADIIYEVVAEGGHHPDAGGVSVGGGCRYDRVHPLHPALLH